MKSENFVMDERGKPFARLTDHGHRGRHRYRSRLPAGEHRRDRRFRGGRVHGRMVHGAAARAWPRTPRRRVILLGAAMGDDLPPSQWANKHPKLAPLFTAVTLLVVAAVTLAWWGILAWLIWRVI
jgi:hypothetical protein